MAEVKRVASPVSVRAATPDDAAFVRSIVPRLFAHRPGWRTAAEMVDGTGRVLEAALARAADDELFVVATDAGGRPIGFAYAVTQIDFFTNEPHAHLSEIVSARDGNGAGDALVRAVETWTRDRGLRYLSLNVLRDNRAALSFYERREFEIETHHLIKVMRPD